MKSGIHDQCSFLFLGADVEPHGSSVPICSTCALPGPHHDFSRHLLLKESLDSVVLAVRLLIRVGFPSLAWSLYAPLHPNEHLVDHGGGELGGAHRAPLRGFWPPSAVTSSAGCHIDKARRLTPRRRWASYPRVNENVCKNIINRGGVCAARHGFDTFSQARHYNHQNCCRCNKSVSSTIAS